MNHKVKPPVPKKEVQILEKHGHRREDPYYWMNRRESRELKEHLKRENEYSKEVMKDIIPLSNTLYKEIRKRIKEDDDTVPYKKGDYYYYDRYLKGLEYPLYCRKKDSLENPEEIFCDINEISKGHDYYSSYYQPSDDNKMYALIYDNVGRFLYNADIQNMENREWMKLDLSNLSGSFEWGGDNETILAVKKNPETLRPYQVISYNIYSGETRIIFEENDESFLVYIYRSADRRYIFIKCSSTTSSEVYYLDADKPDNAFLFAKREKDILYYVDSINDLFLIKTSRDKNNYEIMATDRNNTCRESWKPLIPLRDHVEIDDLTCFTDFFVLSEREKGLVNLRILSYDLETDHKIDFGLEAYLAYVMDTNEAGSNTLRYCIQSFNTPYEVYDYDLCRNQKTLRKRKEVRGSFSPEDYLVRRLNIKAQDDTLIPVSLTYKKNLFKKGGNPLLIKGYGSYGYPEDPHFDNAVISLLDRGFIYAVAHIRGGGDLGRSWYENGKLLKKKNTFNDFLDSTRALIDNGYGHRDKVFAIGGSAGGLLIGAIANMNGDIYKGIVATVPFVDVVTTMLDDRIPLTTFEYEEWGNPENKEHYDYMLSYSPYDNVKPQHYPHMYILTGFHDSQVQYWEPAKWVAKLRDMKTNDSSILFECDMSSGHGGPSGRFRSIKKNARIWAFLLDLAGIKS